MFYIDVLNLFRLERVVWRFVFHLLHFLAWAVRHMLPDRSVRLFFYLLNSAKKWSAESKTDVTNLLQLSSAYSSVFFSVFFFFFFFFSTGVYLACFESLSSLLLNNCVSDTDPQKSLPSQMSPLQKRYSEGNQFQMNLGRFPNHRQKQLLGIKRHFNSGRYMVSRVRNTSCTRAVRQSQSWIYYVLNLLGTVYYCTIYMPALIYFWFWSWRARNHSVFWSWSWGSKQKQNFQINPQKEVWLSLGTTESHRKVR